MASEALQATSDAWLHFHGTVKFKADVGIGDRVALFIPPIMERYKKDFPILVVHTDLAWQTIFMAICASGTESRQDIEDLREAILAAGRR